MENERKGFYDSHIHLNYGPCDTPAEFMKKTAAAGVTAGNIFCPAAHHDIGRADGDYRWQARLDYVLEFTSGTPGFLPFFRFDPTEPDVVEQIETAAEKGIKGYKIICEQYYPRDCMKACEAVAATGMPLMFHSGILGGARDQLSGKFNRPLEFECLFNVKNLRFSMAHVGWPWVDEYMGIVCKTFFVWDQEFNNHLYFDLTPGTPAYYRRETLRKLYLCGYPVKEFVLWGSDCVANEYSSSYAKFWLDLDAKLMDEIVKDSELAFVPWSQTYPDLHDIFDCAAWKNAVKFATKQNL